MSLATRALDTQLDLLRYYEGRGARFAEAVTRAMYESNDEKVPVDGALLKVSASGDTLSETERAMIDEFGRNLHSAILMAGDTFAVTSEILDILEQAAPTVPPYTLHNEDLPNRVGFVLFERPVVVADGFGKPLTVKAFGWHVADATLNDLVPVPHITHDRENVIQDFGMVLLLWTDPTDPRDHIHDEWMTLAGEMRERNLTPPHNLASMLGGSWQFGQPPASPVGNIVMTFLRFIQESWVDSRMMIPDRSGLRRAARAARRVPKIKVVRLRRAAQARTRQAGDGEPIDWQHRWIVSGHWRMQACGPQHSLRRPTWIPEYVKGPEDKPLIVNDHVFSVDR